MRRGNEPVFRSNGHRRPGKLVSSHGLGANRRGSKFHEEGEMRRRFIGFIGSIILAACAAYILPSQGWAQTDATATVSKVDKDNDQTLDLAEVQAAAGAHFDKLDKDADGTLDATEVKRVIGAKMFARADKDNDGTLTKDEYVALVAKLFKRADADHDGTLTAAELQSKTGHALKKLID
jgi:Ca2+-binding EF-hand superfamily protein